VRREAGRDHARLEATECEEEPAVGRKIEALSGGGAVAGREALGVHSSGDETDAGGVDLMVGKHERAAEVAQHEDASCGRKGAPLHELERPRQQTPGQAPRAQRKLRAQEAELPRRRRVVHDGKRGGLRPLQEADGRRRLVGEQHVELSRTGVPACGERIGERLWQKVARERAPDCQPALVAHIVAAIAGREHRHLMPPVGQRARALGSEPRRAALQVGEPLIGCDQDAHGSGSQPLRRQLEKAIGARVPRVLSRE